MLLKNEINRVPPKEEALKIGAYDRNAEIKHICKSFFIWISLDQTNDEMTEIVNIEEHNDNNLMVFNNHKEKLHDDLMGMQERIRKWYKIYF